MRYRLRVLVALAALLGAGGCKQILGLHERTADVSADDGGDDGGVPEAATPAPTITLGTTVPLRYPSPECATCMEKSENSENAK